MTRGEIIALLPEYRDEWVMVKDDQSVRDIVREVLSAHKDFSTHYDQFALLFDEPTIRQICDGLYWFCEDNIEYREESDEVQTTALPAGILTRGFGDCKHYASFCGGVIDAINRKTGKNIKWCYRFASYRLTSKIPHHVFCVVWDENGQEIWIDPTPEARNKIPLWQTDKKISGMALYRNIAGIGDLDVVDVNTITEEDLQAALSEIDLEADISTDEMDVIVTLLNFGVLDEEGNISVARMEQLESELSAEQYQEVSHAYNEFLLKAQIGGFFKDLWRGVKVVTLAIPRNAYLGLVALNVFGMASKMARACETEEGRNKILDKWYSLGGKKDALLSAINSGRKKKAVMGSVNSVGAAQAAAPAWIAVAGAVIAAIMPIVTAILKKQNQYSEFENLDMTLPPEYYSGGGSTGNSFMDFVRANPIPVFAGGALLLYLFLKDDK
jgi:hypothetical protein